MYHLGRYDNDSNYGVQNLANNCIKKICVLKSARVCVRACVRACVPIYVLACVRVCVCAGLLIISTLL
jgi:hypothetical protein